MGALIGLDWGTSAFRAYRIDPGGTVLEQRDDPAGGIMALGDGAWEVFLRDRIGDWLADAAVILACGMIGSRQGWVEAPYCPCPAGAGDLARQLAHISLEGGGEVYFVPGICRREDRRPDVMRGEETQAGGLITGACGGQVLVMPGTHSKWVRARAGRIVDFATFMTGEVFAALRQATILGRLMTPAPAPDWAAFDEGVGHGLAADADGGGLLHLLFGVRSLGLFDRLPATGLADYLSGLLIGTELRDGLRWAAVDPSTQLTLVGGPELVERYRRAASAAGRAAIPAPADAAAAGLHAIAVSAGLFGRTPP